MGTDYYAFQPKPGVESNDLRPLVEKQALHFQSNPYLWHCSTDNEYLYTHKLLDAIHRKPFIEASRALKEKIDFHRTTIKDPWNKDYCIDSHRIFGFTLDIFPPLWRLESLKTVLPEELPDFAEKRKKWWNEIKQGQHREYLASIYCHEVYGQLQSASYTLRGYISSWQAKPRNKKRLTQEFFDRAFRYLPPYLEPELLLTPDQQSELKRNPLEKAAYYTEQVAELKALLKEWDCNSSGSWKTRIYLANWENLDMFINSFQDDWFMDLYNWTQKVIERDQGLYLDA